LQLFVYNLDGKILEEKEPARTQLMFSQSRKKPSVVGQSEPSNFVIYVILKVIEYQELQ
jgi:hypothetical protein